MLTLYGDPRSRAFRCVWMLEELEAEYELIPTSWDGSENRDPKYLALNPNGKVPTLVDEERVIWESLAINLYLAQHCEGPLELRSSQDFALALQWSFWAMGEFEGPIDAEAKRGAHLAPGWGDGPLTTLCRALEQKAWLAGDAFGVADLNVAVFFQRPRLAEVDRKPYPAIHAWLKACRSRPAFSRMLEVARTHAASEGRN